MDRVHQATLDRYEIVDDLDGGDKAVRGARRIADDVMPRRIVTSVVHAHYYRYIGVVCRRADHDFPRSGTQVRFRLFVLSELAGRLQHDIDPEICPWDGARIRFAEDVDGVPVDDEQVVR